jgi:hypothetical protein
LPDNRQITDMVSIEKCKEILGSDISDSDIERLREALYTLVENVLDEYVSSSGGSMELICKNQLSIVGSLQSVKKQKDMV